MPHVPGAHLERKPLVAIPQPRHRPERPPPSRCCGAASWWNGWRPVFPVVARLLDGAIERWELWLACAKCSACRHGFTCYPPGYYPRRQYQLDVAAEVVAQASFGGHSFRQAGALAWTSRTSAWRWSHWVEALASPVELYALAAQLDPDAPAGIVPRAAVAAPLRSAAAQMLAALEQVGVVLLRLWRALGAGSGLGRVLGWQHQVHGLYVGLRARLGGLSPGM